MPGVNVSHLEDLLALMDKLDDVGRLAATLRAQIQRDMEDARRQEDQTDGAGAPTVVPIRVVRTKKRR